MAHINPPPPPYRPNSRQLGLDDDLDAALADVKTVPYHNFAPPIPQRESVSKRPPSIEIQPPTPRDAVYPVISTGSRPLTISSSSLSIADVDKARRVKFAEGKHAAIELVPQPSDDPSDPLVRKEQNLILYTMTTNSNRTYRNGKRISIFSPSFSQQASQTHQKPLLFQLPPRSPSNTTSHLRPQPA